MTDSRPTTLDTIWGDRLHKLEAMTVALEKIRADLTTITGGCPGQYRLRSFLSAISIAADDSRLAQIEMATRLESER